MGDHGLLGREMLEAIWICALDLHLDGKRIQVIGNKFDRLGRNLRRERGSLRSKIKVEYDRLARNVVAVVETVKWGLVLRIFHPPEG